MDTMENNSTSTVYLTREISPESLVKIYKALNVEATGRVAVKMSTGEGSNPNYLKPELIKNLIFTNDSGLISLVRYTVDVLLFSIVSIF